MLDLLLHRRDRLYIELKLEQLLKKAFDGESTLVLTQGQKEALKPFLVSIAERMFRETPIIDHWGSFCNALTCVSCEVQQKPVGVAFVVLRHLLIQEEMTDTPPEYANSLYRNGIEVKSLLFDCLNLICGYHDFNDALDEFPHVAVVFESIQSLLRPDTSEERAWNFIDSICISLFVSINQNDNGWRCHFPVVIETNMNKYFHRGLPEAMQVADTAFSYIEVQG